MSTFTQYLSAVETVLRVPLPATRQTQESIANIYKVALSGYNFVESADQPVYMYNVINLADEGNLVDLSYGHLPTPIYGVIFVKLSLYQGSDYYPSSGPVTGLLVTNLDKVEESLAFAGTQLTTFEASDIYQEMATGAGTFYNSGLYFVSPAPLSLAYPIKNFYGCPDECQGFVFLSFTFYEGEENNIPIAISLIINYQQCDILNIRYSVQTQSDEIVSTFAAFDQLQQSALSCPYGTIKFNYDNYTVKIE